MKVKISNDVVAVIAGVAVSEVNGVISAGVEVLQVEFQRSI